MDGAHQAELGYKFKGTTDVAVVDKVAYRADECKVHELSSLCKPVSVQPVDCALSHLCCLYSLYMLQNGLRLLYELKKKPDAAAAAQAKIFLLLANIHSAK